MKNLIDNFLLWLNEWSLEQCDRRGLITWGHDLTPEQNAELRAKATEYKSVKSALTQLVESGQVKSDPPSITADRLHPALIVGPIGTGKTYDLKQLARECFTKQSLANCYVWSRDSWRDVEAVASDHNTAFERFGTPFEVSAIRFMKVIDSICLVIKDRVQENCRDGSPIFLIIDDVSLFTSYLEPHQIEQFQVQLRRFGRVARKYGVHLLASDCTGTVRDMKVFIDFPRYPASLAANHPDYDPSLGRKRSAAHV